MRRISSLARSGRGNAFEGESSCIMPCATVKSRGFRLRALAKCLAFKPPDRTRWLVRDAEMNPSNEQLVSLFERMTLIRLMEERLRADAAAGKLPGAVHLYIGQEAVAVGVCANLRDADWITSTHRGHGHFLAKGGD